MMRAMHGKNAHFGLGPKKVWCFAGVGLKCLVPLAFLVVFSTTKFTQPVKNARGD